MSRSGSRPFEDAHAFGLEPQEAILAYLARKQGARIWKADHPEGGAQFRDSNGLPIPDLIKLETGRGATLVEVKAREEWWQEGGTRGPLETPMEARQIRAYAEVSQRYLTPVVVVFVMRPAPGVLTSRGYPPRGHAGCYYAPIGDLVAVLSTAPPFRLPLRGGGTVEGRNLRRRCDGGPLRPLCPWDEAAKAVPMDPAAWAAWLAMEPESPRPPAVTHQSGLPFE